MAQTSVSSLQKKLQAQLPGLKLNQSLSQHTTFAIGGPAQFFFTASTTHDLIKAVTLARQLHLPFYLLGHGSNLLIADRGLKGLVIKNQTDNIEILKQPPASSSPSGEIKPRYQALNSADQDLLDLDYQPQDYHPVFVRLDSGVFLPKAIFQLINQGITGLEWFAGIPATVGGAVFINLHGGHKYFSDYLIQADIFTSDNQTKTVPASFFDFDYDHSRLKQEQSVVLTVTLKLCRGPQDKALKIAKTWALKKSHQPQRSAGCLFQNLSQQQQKSLKLPTPSIGYLIDKQLHLKGKTIGEARIALQHAGFVENLGQAQARDVYQLIKLIKTQAKDKLGIDLKLEIVPLGFTQEELKEIGE